LSLDESYADYPRIEAEFQDFLDGSLSPRGPSSLFDLVGTLELPVNGEAIDVGCGEGEEGIELAQRVGLRVHGVDPVQRHIDLPAAQTGSLGGSFDFRPGVAEALPFPDASADLVWCKEVLMFADLRRAFAEFKRVLRPGGVGLVYQVLSGPRMNDAEAYAYWSHDLGYGEARSVRPADIEAAIASAGLNLQRRVDFASEWGEYAQEHTGAGGRRLVHAARLLRDPRRYIDKYGETNYHIMLGDCLWHVYRMIGKLHGAAFIFNKSEP